MINKIYKIIHNKFSRFFKFIFFLRYLFAIFFVAIVLFVTIPQFFDYKKKELVIFSNLSASYGLDIEKIQSIKFKSFPIPHLQIDNLTSNYLSGETKLQVDKLLIFPKLISIYNYDKFEVKKIKLSNSFLKTDVKKLSVFIKKIFDFNSKITFEDLNIKIKESDNSILELKNVNFSNYGYHREKINGEIFDKKFIIKILDNFRSVDFILEDTGISAKLNLLDNATTASYAGIFKGSILKSNYKLDFIYEEDSIKINSFFFRDKKLSFDSVGNIELVPFFKINLVSEIKNYDKKIFENIRSYRISDFETLIKKLNFEKNIIYKSKLFSDDLIDNLDIKSKLAYGRLNISKKLIIAESKLDCLSKINLLEEFPVLYFECIFNSSDKKELLKKFDISFKKKDQSFYLDVKGNLNIFNNKINFDHIKMNNSYNATEEDLKYFKFTFENILFQDNFFKIFNLQKIKKFVLEIS